MQIAETVSKFLDYAVTVIRHNPRTRVDEAVTRYLRQRDLEARGISSGRSQTARMVEFYDFPTGVLITPNVRGYPEDEVEKWLAARPVEAKPPGGAAKVSRERKLLAPSKLKVPSERKAERKARRLGRARPEKETVVEPA